MKISRRLCGVWIQIVVATAVGAGCSERPPAPDTTTAGNAEVDALFAQWDVPGSPGCGLAIAQGGELVYSRGYGYANLDYGIPITPDSVFDVASVTKQFSAASIVMLAQEGRLSLDDNVRQWLPELPEFDQPITLQHMLNHSSGLRDYLTLFPLAGRNDHFPISHPQILAMMSRQRAPDFAPGEQYSYSNTAYMLLAQVVERVSGQSFGEFTAQRIFEPLEMHSSFMYDNREKVVPHRSIGYYLQDDGSARIVHNYNFDVAGDGQLYSTMEDLLLWDEYLHGAEKAAIHAQLLTDQFLNNGDFIDHAQGIRQQQYRGLETVGHSGSSWGFRTELVRFVDAGLSVAISCNMDNISPQRLARQVADIYLVDSLGSEPEPANTELAEEEPAPARPAARLEQLADFVGIYYSEELDATYRFTLHDDALFVQIEQERPVVVVPTSNDRFEFAFHPEGWGGPSDIPVEFDRNRAGEVAGSGSVLAMGPASYSSGAKERIMSMRNYAGLLFATLVIVACSPQESEPGGTVITNARVVDGSGAPSSVMNVRIVGERIAAVGDFEPSSGDAVVDATGLVLAPGFIDTHSHHDYGLLETPGALAAVSQGITTLIAGQDGGHEYPLAEEFGLLDAEPGAVNVASYAGHGTLREQVLGDDYQRHATADEVAAMVELLRIEMEAGALGLSSGLEYDPGSFSDTAELIALARESARHGGRYITHFRSEDQYFWEALDEAAEIGREAGLPVQISHIKLAMTRWWGQADKLKAKLDKIRASGVDMTVDVYPYGAWNASFSWLTTLFPDRDLDRRDGADYILNDMLSPAGIVIPDFLPDPAYNGMSVEEIAAIRETDDATTLMDLLKEEAAYQGGTSPMLGFAMDEPDIESIMAWSHTVICSDGELDGPHPRGFGAFTRFLGHYVRDRKVVSLEEGIRKMTALSAANVGIEERGLIEVGRYADLVLIDLENVIDRATYDKPNVPSDGIEAVWVNGQVVFDEGSTTGKRPGKTLRHQRD